MLLALLCATTVLAATGGLRGFAAPVPAAGPLLVPVPAAFVPAGTKGREIELRMARFDRSELPHDVLTSAADLGSAEALTTLPANLPISASSFRFEVPSGNLPIERIPPGMRAMTIQVDAAASLDGLTQAGSLVDVLLVESGRTSVVAEQVTVLSIDRSAPRSAGGAAVTLLVSQEQCLAVNTAVPLGRIAFALRNENDRERWARTRLSAESVTGARAVKDKSLEITGYASVKSEGAVQRFVLADGKWMRSAGEHPDAIAEATVGDGVP